MKIQTVWSRDLELLKSFETSTSNCFLFSYCTSLSPLVCTTWPWPLWWPKHVVVASYPPSLARGHQYSCVYDVFSHSLSTLCLNTQGECCTSRLQRYSLSTSTYLKLSVMLWDLIYPLLHLCFIQTFCTPTYLYLCGLSQCVSEELNLLLWTFSPFFGFRRLG